MSRIATGSRRIKPSMPRQLLVYLVVTLICVKSASAIDPAASGQLPPPTAPDAEPSARAEPGAWNVHGQFTFVEQFHPHFRSPYEGANSLTSARNGKETADLT